MWNFGCGADDCKYLTYDVFDENGDNIAREVSYDDALLICELHNATQSDRETSNGDEKHG